MKPEFVNPTDVSRFYHYISVLISSAFLEPISFQGLHNTGKYNASNADRFFIFYNFILPKYSLYMTRAVVCCFILDH